MVVAPPVQVQQQSVSVTAHKVSVMIPTIKVCGSTEFMDPSGTVAKAPSWRLGMQGNKDRKSVV